MTDSSGRRHEAEARLAAAKAELAAAEQAYREVVPCEHRSMTISYSHRERFSCSDCGAELPDPRGCQHLRIGNDTEQCVECGEKMLRPHHERVTVRSAPNKAACTIPDCDGGPGCENPDGIYLPDSSREREVVVRIDVTYECERCRNDGTAFTLGELPIWDCGRVHRGDSIPVRDGVPA